MLLPDNYETRVKQHDNPLLPTKSGRMSEVASTGLFKPFTDLPLKVPFVKDFLSNKALPIVKPHAPVCQTSAIRL
jgi:hypothetical protein